MRIFRDSATLLIRSKILLTFMILLFGFVVWEVGSLYGKTVLSRPMRWRWRCVRRRQSRRWSWKSQSGFCAESQSAAGDRKGGRL